jgi:hypothetical protein
MDPEVESKGRMKGYGPVANHFKSLWIRKSTFRVDGQTPTQVNGPLVHLTQKQKTEFCATNIWALEPTYGE